MARRKTSWANDRPKRKRIKRWHAVAMFFLLGCILFLVFLPRIATSKSILVGAVDRFANIAPLKVDFEGVSAGWFSPISAKGIKIFDGEGNELARVGDVTTEKGVFGWIADSSNLGTIRVSNFETAIVAMDGTTNIEKAIAPLLEQFVAAEETQATDESATAAAPMLGTIEIVSSRVLLAEQGRPEKWVVELPHISASLPTGKQLIGPIVVEAKIANVAGNASAPGTIAANAKQSAEDQSFELRAKLDNVPVDFWHVVKARLPSLPVEELQGRVSGTLAGSIANDELWAFDLQQLEASNLLVVAPDLVGEQPAKLEKLLGVAKCRLHDATLHLEQVQVACDFANTAASATIPWPLQIPTASHPFIDGAVINALGTIDLPKLVTAAESLIPVREDMQLQTGQAQFSVSQSLDAQARPSNQAKFQLSNLSAFANGQQLTWQEPLTIELGSSNASGVLEISAIANAEFANLQGGGTIEAGQLSGNVNLGQLKERLSQWVELPIQDMEGTAGLNMNWKMDASQNLMAQGNLSTTPIAFATSIGKRLEEPAWNGSFTTTIKMASATPQRIEKARVQLQGQQERLTVDLLGPLALMAGDATTQTAPFSIDLQTDLEKCERRGMVWLEEPPEMNVSGKLQLAVSGNIDLAHVEVLNANFNAAPLSVITPQFSFAEPQIVGKFNGRVDTNDLTRLVVDVLQVQSTSFSMGAQDSANPDGSNSRIGRAAFRANLDQLMRNVATVAPANAANSVPANASDSKLGVTGILDGQLAWQISPTSAGINTKITGNNVVVTTHSAQQPTPSTLWEETQLVANIAGTWVAATNAIDLPQVVVQTPWLNFDGNLKYGSDDTSQVVTTNGNATYDCGLLSQKLLSYTGGQFRMAGKKVAPVQISWKSSADPEASVLAGLDASVTLGWQQAEVAGIQVGNSDVPIQVVAGVANSAAEIPVSGGALRWDFTTDLAADELAISQKPMRVLENVEITDQMCKGWLKYVTPLLAEATSVDGRLSMDLSEGYIVPMNPAAQTVAGTIVIHNATIGPGPLSSDVITLVKQVDAIRKQDFTQVVSSQQRVWMDMPEQNIAFEMRDGRVIHRDLRVKVGDTSISTSGSVGVAGDMDMLATMPIPDDWADKSPYLAGFRGQSLQFPIGGTLTNPKVDSNSINNIGKQTLQNAATGVIQQQLSRGLDKLLGSPPPAADPGTAPQPNNSGALRGLGEQILGGQGLNLPGLPGLFPGGN